MTEATTHAATPWTPVDRQRRSLALRFKPHDVPTVNWFGEPGSKHEFLPDVITRRLAPKMLELTEFRGTHEPLKAIASQAVVQLSPSRADVELQSRREASAKL